MSLLIADPELIETAAQNLSGIRATLGEATAAAATPTTGVAAAAADEVSTAIATVFGQHGREFQAVSPQAAGFHDRFVQLLNSGAASYLATEAANAQQGLSNIVNAPAGGAASQLSGRIGAAQQAVTQAVTGAPAAVKTLSAISGRLLCYRVLPLPLGLTKRCSPIRAPTCSPSLAP